MLKKLFGGLFGGSDKQPQQPELTFEQRRRGARRPCNIEVECRIGRSDVQAAVVDMSVGGLRIHFPSPQKLKSKSLLKVTYPDPDGVHQVQTVECLTKWTRRRESDGTLFAGVEFKDPKALGRSWVKTKMQELGFRPYNIKEQRTDYRVFCDLKASVDVGGAVLPCRIKNIGLGGLYLELTKPIRAGASLEIKIFDNPGFPTLGLGATVRHQQHVESTDPWGYGVAFKVVPLQAANALREFIQSRQQEEWEALTASLVDEDEEDSDFGLAEEFEENDEAEDVEIPSLDSIMAETEVPEEELEDAEEAEEPEEPA